MILPLALPGMVAGSIFTFSLTLGDYITPILVGNIEFIGNVVYRNVLGLTLQPPLRRRLRDRAAARDGDLPRARRAGPARSRRSDGEPR